MLSRMKLVTIARPAESRPNDRKDDFGSVPYNRLVSPSVHDKVVKWP